jgi:hypothetical protein
MSVLATDYGVIGLGFISLLVIVVACVFLLKRQPSMLAIQKKSKMLSASKKRFFETLINDLGNEFYIFAGVGMRGIVELAATANRRQRKEALKEISDGYFDFVLVSPATMSTYAVIKLQDFGVKNQNMRKARENAVTRICESANLKLFYFDIREDYSRKDITRLITGKPGRVGRPSIDHQSELELQSRSYTVDGHMRVCPKCRSELVTKIATKGSRLGEKFHLCRKYPYCDFRIAAKDNQAMESLDMEELKRKHKAANKKAYNNWGA